MKKTKKTTHSNYRDGFDFITLLVSIIAGALGFFISHIVYGLVDEMWSPLAIAIEFLVFFIVVVIVQLIYQMVNDNLGRHVYYHHDTSKLALSIIACLLSAFLLAIVFEFIYELNFFNKNAFTYNEPTSYIFIIDDSGSMTSSDPEGLRYEAIEEIIEDQDDDFYYAVYSFNDDLKLERELSPKSDGEIDYDPENNGGTTIRTSLDEIFEAYEEGKLDGLGDNPKFLLLSDGYATDISVFDTIGSVLKQYINGGFTISTVGLGNADDELMQEIADQTGGVYISVDEADELEDAMQSAITSTSDDLYSRTLFTYRYVLSLNIVYALLRVIFLSLLGFIVSISMLFCSGKGDDEQMIFISSIITAFVGALLVELGINVLGFSANIMHFIYDLLIASLFITVREYMGKPYHSSSRVEASDSKIEIDDDDDFFGDMNELL